METLARTLSPRTRVRLPLGEGLSSPKYLGFAKNIIDTVLAQR
ncbi:hypothetical protein [Nostoc sp. UHCC 0302]